MHAARFPAGRASDGSTSRLVRHRAERDTGSGLAFAALSRGVLRTGAPLRSLSTRPDGTKKRGGVACRALRQLRDDAGSDLADGIDRANHRLLADEDIVEKTFELCRLPGIDQGRVRSVQRAE